jgi:hypothetical protein
MMTKKQLAAIERARHTPAVIVEIRRERKRSRSFTVQELIELILRPGVPGKLPEGPLPM